MFAAKAVRIARAAVGAAIVATAASSSAADIDRYVPPTYPALQKMKPAEVMHMMDPGNKGYVTREEFMKFQEEFFKKIDRNGEGKLDKAEFTDRG